MNDNMWMILAMGFTVFAVRSVAFVFANYISLPKPIKDALELLPPAILIVIVANGILLGKKGTGLDISFANHYLIAAVATFIIATKIKNFFGIIFSGYLVFLLVSHLAS